MQTQRSLASSLAVALLATAMAVLARAFLWYGLGVNLPYMPCFAAVAVAAWFGGLLSGVTALLLSVVTIVYAILDPGLTFSFSRQTDVVGIVLFMIVGGTIAGFVEMLHVAQRTAVRRNDQLRHEIAERSVTERQLQERERELADFFENANVGMHWADADGRIVRVNHEELRMLGYTMEEFVGHHISEFHVDQDVVAGIMQELADGRIVHNRRAVMRCKDGTAKPVSINSSPRMEQGRFLQSRCFTLDMSERAAAERAEQELRLSETRFRMIADNISVLAWESAPDSAPSWYNRRWHEFTGISPDKACVDDWEAVQHPEYRERVRASMGQSRACGSEWEETFPMRRADGTYRWFLCRCVPIRSDDGAILRWFGTCADVTDRVEMEQALREADRRKDEFVATMAHELRNPLAPMQHALLLLEHNADKSRQPDPVIAIMQRQLRHMNRLVDDLIDLSRITRGQLELRHSPVDLSVVVNDAVDMVRPMAEASQHQLSVTLPAVPVRLYGDAVRLTQVFTNLLRNACKFTDPSGSVSLTAVVEGDQVVVSIRDNGIGIPRERLSQVFDMFAQGHPAIEQSRGGLGIGLTIVKWIVERHHGQVVAQSDGPGTGSTLVVTLPALKSTPVIRSEPATTRTGQARVPLRVLVVDDNRDSADSLALLLRLHGHEVETAHDGDAAVTTFASSHPQVVLLDIGLPKRSGHDACRAIRAQSGGTSALVIAVTGWGQDGDRQRSRDAGFDAHLVKPVDHEALLRMMVEAAPRLQ